MANYTIEFYGDEEFNVRILIMENQDILYVDALNDKKFFNINKEIAVQADYVNGIGWNFGVTILDPDVTISDNYKFALAQSIENPASPKLIIYSSIRVKIDGIFGDNKSAVKSLLGKYGIVIDEDKLIPFANDFKKTIND